MRMYMAVDIDAPPEAVWPFLVDPSRTMQWYDMLKVFVYTSEPGPGATFYWEEEVRGKVYRNHFRTIEWVPDRVFAFDMTESSFFKGYSERWSIDPTPTGSRFSFDDHLAFPYGPWGRIMGWFGERMGRRSGQRVLRRLKRLAEAEHAALHGT